MKCCDIVTSAVRMFTVNVSSSAASTSSSCKASDLQIPSLCDVAKMQERYNSASSVLVREQPRSLERLLLSDQHTTRRRRTTLPDIHSSSRKLAHQATVNIHDSCLPCTKADKSRSEPAMPSAALVSPPSTCLQCRLATCDCTIDVTADVTGSRPPPLRGALSVSNIIPSPDGTAVAHLPRAFHSLPVFTRSADCLVCVSPSQSHAHSNQQADHLIMDKTAKPSSLLKNKNVSRLFVRHTMSVSARKTERTVVQLTKSEPATPSFKTPDAQAEPVGSSASAVRSRSACFLLGDESASASCVTDDKPTVPVFSKSIPGKAGKVSSPAELTAPVWRSVLRLKLVNEGDVQVCRLHHPRTVMSKILGSKFLRRWETHHLFLNDACLSSKTPVGFMENSVPYTSIEDISIIVGWDSGHRHCLRVIIPDGSLLIQTNNSYIRDQWFYSLQWKKNLFRFHQVTRSTTRPEVLLKEVKNMVELATTTPLQDSCISQTPFQIISTLVATNHHALSQPIIEELLMTFAPLLEKQHPSKDICATFSRHCALHPRSPLVRGLFTSVVHRILKYNADFGKHPYLRRFVQDYIRVLYAQNDGPEAVSDFVKRAHGESSACPHPRVLPNLVAVCLAAVFSIFNLRRRRAAGSQRNINSAPCRPRIAEDGVRNRADGTIHPQDRNESGSSPSIPPSPTPTHHEDETEQALLCYLNIINTISSYEDWRPGLAQLLQPIPFPDDALADETFIKGMYPVIRSIGVEARCEIHKCVLGIREGKEGWFHIVCPSSAACPDNGNLWASILQTLLGCCCRRKKFVQSLTKMLGACQLLALRDHSSAQEALCLMLEWSLLDQGTTSEHCDESNTLSLQVVTTLQSTASGRRYYSQLCDRQFHLKELQQKGGPKKLTLPSRSTDSDLAKLLSCGSFGNLECLSLAFTQVTSACAEHLIKLPSLRYLNLWSTQFGDSGLQLLSEHLHKLQVLNLCETPVSDKGLACLATMKSLRKLNLNSTNLSAAMFENLKQKLPCLQEVDVRYTDAW